jgi:plasmid stabilization system protein ParE
LKRLRVRWSTSASLDLIEIIEFASQDRPQAAQKLGREILQAASRLARHPRSGKILPELQEQGISDYRQVLVRPYRLIYALRAESIDIVVVVDARRDLQTALLQRLMR